MPLLVKYQEFKPVPEGTYVAQLVKLEEVTHKQFGETIKWSFDIIEPVEHVGTTVTGLSSTKVSPKSKLFSWVNALGSTLDPGESFDMEQLIGKRCRIKTKNNTRSRNVNGAQQEMTFSNVDKVGALTPEQAKAMANVATSPTPVSTASDDFDDDSTPVEKATVVAPDELEDGEDFDF